MPSPQYLHLLFNPTLKVAGETVHGEVHLNFPSLMKDEIEAVYVKLQGFVYTQIYRQITPNIDGRRDQRMELVNQSVCVWKQDERVYPPTGSETLKRQFTFKLPDNLLPSFECGKRGNQGGRVRYFVQAFGKRPAASWRADPSVVMPFPVFPSLSSGAELRETLRQGWRGSWRSFSQEKDIRRGIWGEHSHVKATLTIPRIDALPVLTPIPYTLTITTHSKPMKRSENDSIPTNLIFPVPPNPDQVDFWVESDAFIRADTWAAAINGSVVVHLGGLGSSGTNNKVTHVEPVYAETAGKVWIPSTGDKNDQRGRWKQEIVFRSNFFLTCAPSFTSDLIDVKHNLKLRVDFPGVGNSLNMEVPVKIISSIYPPEQKAWDGPPPALELPPTYYQTIEWDHDEKK
ncbi:hypothetical protein BDY19DRAFT_222077 [Irpex rosettiformis]|uniref:Uncharacterized protein n=1 Tax=Irpex rosettiformis TaxID=378272 RepID=A0ACB8U085_9APHY|nr:hypothetical protein BDY19DRAFT_222077 [Irpex rosettiformis]